MLKEQVFKQVRTEILDAIKERKGEDYALHVEMAEGIIAASHVLKEAVEPLTGALVMDTMGHLLSRTLEQYTKITGKEVDVKEIIADADMLYTNVLTRVNEMLRQRRANG